MDGIQELNERIQRLERQLRAFKTASIGVIALAIIAGLGGWRTQDPRVVRTGQVIIEDDQGRERMRIGPQCDFGGQRMASMGIAIDDSAGYERFGLGLKANGRMSMGFDAPPGKGDDRNRERINIIADEEGGAQIRFLDRQTYVKGRLHITPDNRFEIVFLDFTDDQVRYRLMDFSGERMQTKPR